MDQTAKLHATLNIFASIRNPLETVAFVLLSAVILLAQYLPDAPGAALAVESQQAALNSGDAAPQSTTPAQSNSQTKTSSTNNSQSTQNSEPKQTKRMLWVVPNFGAVSAGVKFTPLSPRQKFVLASHDSFDYSSFVWTAMITAQSYGLDSDPELGRGFAGYMRYYWRAFADGVSGTFFTEAIVPVVTHEDPRYFTLGRGGFWRRLSYSLSRTVITKTDSNGTSFDWSEVGGNALEASLSNAYYPPQERGLHQTLRDWGDQMESAALNNIAKEFWPDIRRDVFRQK
ncbi:MAG TPA: hypothetical protein VMB18_09995 [Terriglobales bacterium]|nr:hypothetical protein [Terriglobales bacterium]